MDEVMLVPAGADVLIGAPAEVTETVDPIYRRA